MRPIDRYANRYVLPRVGYRCALGCALPRRTPGSLLPTPPSPAPILQSWMSHSHPRPAIRPKLAQETAANRIQNT